jgi:hypothetical protein
MHEAHMNAKHLMIILKEKKNIIREKTEKGMNNASLKIDSLSYL